MKTITMYNIHVPNDVVKVSWKGNNKPHFEPDINKSLAAYLLHNWLDQDMPANTKDTHITQYFNGLKQEDAFWNGIRLASKLGFRRVEQGTKKNTDWYGLLND